MVTWCLGMSKDTREDAITKAAAGAMDTLNLPEGMKSIVYLVLSFYTTLPLLEIIVLH